MFFRFDDIVFPLRAVFMGFPASGVVGAKIAMVDVADDFCAHTEFSARTEAFGEKRFVTDISVGGKAKETAFFNETVVRKK